MAEITVRGAGIFGLSIAWACVQRGARVHVIDPYGPGAGASGGIVGALAPHVPENWNAKKAFQLDSLVQAEAFWQEVEEIGGRSAGYARMGRLQPIADDAALELAFARELTARQLWPGHVTWQVMDQQDAGPWAPPSPTGRLIKDTLTARIHPRLACAALVAALSAKGVTVQTDGTPRGETVWATGWQGLQDMNRSHARSVGNGVKGQAVLLDHDARNQPQLFIDGLHIVPHVDGTTAVGSTSERDFSDPASVDAQCDVLLQRASAALPALAVAPIRERWAGVRPRARSRAPMLGHWPDRPGHFIANGGFKIGFGMAPKIAQVMADLLIDGDNAIPPEFQVGASL